MSIYRQPRFPSSSPAASVPLLPRQIELGLVVSDDVEII